jgi:hypothetical protein
MTTLDELNAEAAAKALDDIGELIDQLAGNAREFDFNTANRMERDAAKALLIIEGAINALPGLLAICNAAKTALGHLDDPSCPVTGLDETRRARAILAAALKASPTRAQGESS